MNDRTVWVGTLLVLGGLALWMLQWRMWKEVNRRLPTNRQWPYWQVFWWDAYFCQVQKQHRQLLPHSRLRLLFNLLAVLWFILAVTVGHQALDDFLSLFSDRPGHD